MPNMPNYPKIVDQRLHGHPRPRLSQAGYTMKGGSPTSYQVKLEGEKIWRRVYVWQTSNCGTCFIKVLKMPVIISI